jgi:Collagen triple helix repeat (20 copies)
MLKHLKSGTILGIIAIVLALVGTATATTVKIVTTKDIADGTIRNQDIHKDSVSLNRLSQGVQKLIAGSSADSSVPGVAGKDGAQGPKGDAGATGPKGDRGDSGPQGPKGDKGDRGDKGDAADEPRVVTANALRGFVLAPKGDNGDTSPNGTVGFDAPPVAPTLGTKSLKFTSDTGKPVVVYAPLPSGYDGVTGPRPLLAELTKVSYASLIHAQPQTALDVGFQFEVVKSKATAFASGYTTVVYEPYQNESSETLDEWHRHSVDNGKVWSTKPLPSGDCTQAVPCSFRTFVEQNPNAEVLTAKLRIGQNSGQGWSGFEGYVDDLSFGFGPVVRYDFGG